MPSAAPKKASFGRGGPVWLPRSNAADDRLGGVWGGFRLPSQKPGGLGAGAAPPSQNRKNSKNMITYEYDYSETPLDLSLPFCLVLELFGDVNVWGVWEV